MENSGVGMLLGDTSVTALWMMFIGAFILGGTIRTFCAVDDDFR